MSSLQLSDLEVGDLIKVTTVLRVTDVGGGWGWGLDEKSGRHYVFDRSEISTQKLELLHRPTPKPSVGDVIAAETVVKTQWKRGSVLQNTKAPEFVFILTADGVWINSSGRAFTFDEFQEHHAPTVKHYKVIHLGQ